jgi:hypothetical protein
MRAAACSPTHTCIAPPFSITIGGPATVLPGVDAGVRASAAVLNSPLGCLLTPALSMLLVLAGPMLLPGE